MRISSKCVFVFLTLIYKLGIYSRENIKFSCPTQIKN